MSTNVVVHYMTTNVPVEVVAPISADTGIVNVMTEVKGGNVAIPDSWAKGFATFETKFGSNFTDALKKQTGKYDCNNTPMLVWQDYVAGTDPTNPDDTFTATITMVEGDGEGRVFLQSTSHIAISDGACNVVVIHHRCEISCDTAWR